MTCGFIASVLFDNYSLVRPTVVHKSSNFHPKAICSDQTRQKQVSSPPAHPSLSDPFQFAKGKSAQRGLNPVVLGSFPRLLPGDRLTAVPAVARLANIRPKVVQQLFQCCQTCSPTVVQKSSESRSQEHQPWNTTTVDRIGRIC